MGTNSASIGSVVSVAVSVVVSVPVLSSPAGLVSPEVVVAATAGTLVIAVRWLAAVIWVSSAPRSGVLLRALVCDEAVPVPAEVAIAAADPGRLAWSAAL
jgi:hypothetical protein